MLTKKVLLIAPMSSIHERFNIANINVLKKMHCEIHVAANFESDEHSRMYKQKLISNGIIVHHISFKRSSLVKNINCVPILQKLFENERFDLIHTHTETGGILTRLAMIKCRYKSKYVFTPHGMSFYHGSSIKSQVLFKPIEYWISRSMNANIAMNEEEYLVLKKWNSETAKYIHGVGVDISKYRDITVDIKKKKDGLGLPQNSMILLSVGELNQNKNHEVIIKALAKIAPNNPNLFYLICGEGEKRNQLRKLATDLNMNNRVIMPGYRYDIAEIFKIADLFAFPSFHEGLPTSMIQAMSVGLPIVCSNIRGNVDLIKNNEGGFLCHPGDIDSFAEKIEKLLKDKKLCLKFGTNNARNSLKYDIKNVENETERIYKDLLL